MSAAERYRSGRAINSNLCFGSQSPRRCPSGCCWSLSASVIGERCFVIVPLSYLTASKESCSDFGVICSSSAMWLWGLRSHGFCPSTIHSVMCGLFTDGFLQLQTIVCGLNCMFSIPQNLLILFWLASKVLSITSKSPRFCAVVILDLL